MTYDVADLFSGCGGFSLGFHEQGDFTTRIAVDAWDGVLETHRANFGRSAARRSDLSDEVVRRELSREIKNIDVLIGGPPCQGFSTLGKRRDDDKRSTLVDAFAEIFQSTVPTVALVENVRGITTKRHPSGGSFADVLRRSLREAAGFNYACSERILNAVDFGIPQNRQRWFMLAIRSDAPNVDSLAEDFWSQIDGQRTERQATVREAIFDLPRLKAGQGDEVVDFLAGGRVRSLYNHRAMNHSTALVKRFEHVPPGGGLLDVPRELLTSHLRKMVEGAYGSGGHVKNVYGRMEWDRPSGTIVAGIDKITCGRFVHPEDHRLLTPRECARLQSFPDTFRLVGGQVTQYYAVGNAVPPRLAEIIASATSELMRKLGRASRRSVKRARRG